jgi:hypothetical protein
MRPESDLASTMKRLFLTLGLAVIVAACTPGSPVYFGPPIVTLGGTVADLETTQPLAYAEVCVFTSDTLCVKADKGGTYRVAFHVSNLLEGGRADVRFRSSGYPTALLELSELVEGTYSDTHCVISRRLTLGSQPVTCISPNE